MEHANIKDFIVITSIHEPTEAILSFSKKVGYQLVVVGDEKTPSGWFCENATYLSTERQNKIGSYLNKVLPYNHYCRKMIGYLYSIASGADTIVDTDDDNIPYHDWAFPDYEGVYSTVIEDQRFINIYQLYTDKNIWPRGLPINLITKSFSLENKLENKVCKVGIWQGLADEAPDVDAIYRLTNDKPVFFEKREPIVLGKGTISPFNTQNTVITKELFPLLYLPSFVTFRFTDILRGLIAQPIMWLYNYQLGFTNATVVQKRNPHDYFKDFLSEIPMFMHCEKLVDITISAINANDSIQNNLFNAYDELHKNKVVAEKELITLEAWLKDLEHIKNNNETVQSSASPRM